VEEEDRQNERGGGATQGEQPLAVQGLALHRAAVFNVRRSKKCAASPLLKHAVD
jgi:hypothetical protein